ncbi:fructose-specific PTS transporter subunit EIIC [Tsukamurella sp. 8F]|uniref:PTS fructose transporter subunit IIABC n=1 Tax=unclassified Tsukamurella TaxID=2633480 RepID=UPI0023B908DC|nr:MULTISPECIES: fructose-specific PTS transporter subunit EIIC [unclassified Tsukamurella]MDF0531519.1 fructose-specific PTS transporter subunit EIIC [Tsukamurella sp. 8J]MDF0588763.1 fructose-specific PTS transporter subunit EIIC [Tsukamurella sp. 8F]
MSDTPIIAPSLVALDVAAGTTKQEVISYLAHRIAADGRADSADGLIEAALAREEQSATGLPGGIAIPHCRTEAVTTAGLGFARLSEKVDFGAPDGPADVVFLIAAPASGGSQHMKLLSSLARALVRPDFVASLRQATSEDEVVALVEGVLGPKPKPATETAAASAVTATAAANVPADAGAAQEKKHSIVAVTACPTGIAHTYMAADALKYAAERAGVDLFVETQGSSATTPADSGVIEKADAVIFATDVGVKGRERFGGKPVVASGVKRAINEPDTMIAEAVAASSDPDAPRVQGSAAAYDGAAKSGEVGIGTRIRQILLTGVSYMIPFVAAGGLLIALGFLIGGWQLGLTPDKGSHNIGTMIALDDSLAHLPATASYTVQDAAVAVHGGFGTYLGAVLVALGGLAFSFLVPVLAGYIAFAMADRPGLAPGFTAGAVAVAVGAGFIGGLVGGVLAGFAAIAVSRIPLPAWMRGLMPVIIIPLLSSLAVGLVMFMLLGRPLASLTSWLQSELAGMNGSSKIVLGVILGLMMCFDLGGPVNKAAYAFAVQGLGTGGTAELHIMAAVMCAGMVPPLAMGVATFVRKRLFTEAERENGVAAIPLGLCFISEGAIPFAAADPLRVIPSMMLGGASAGAMIMALDVGLRAPHGGIFVFFAMNNALGFVVALVVGTVVGAAAVLVAKTFFGAKPKAVAQEPERAPVAV